MNVRTRIAPSPTGDLHIGHMRTIIYDYALAKKNNGQFIVRIEDTDRERFVEGSMDRTLDVIKAYGLDWDEGPRVGGKFGRYIQSERLEIYKKYAMELIEKGLAYYCFMTEEETKELQERSRLEKRKLRSPYREYEKSKIDELLKSGKSYVIRLKVPENEVITFNDAILGTVSYNTNEVDDQIILKSDGFPTYHLAVVVDDHLMEITHVLRGNDWLPSTPKHILLYRAFGWDIPVFAHLPNLKEKDSNKKLSKRFGAVFAVQFLENGFLPEALVNFLILLGWSSPEERKFGEKEREIYSLDEFVQLFDLNRVHKAAMVSFDRQKLIWFNKEHMKMKSNQELAELYKKWLIKYSKPELIDAQYKELILTDNNLDQKIALVKERVDTFIDLTSNIKFFYYAPGNIDWTIKQLVNVSDKLSEIKSKLFTLL